MAANSSGLKIQVLTCHIVTCVDGVRCQDQVEGASQGVRCRLVDIPCLQTFPSSQHATSPHAEKHHQSREEEICAAEANADLKFQLGVADHLQQVGAKGRGDVSGCVSAQLREWAAVQLSNDL